MRKESLKIHEVHEKQLRRSMFVITFYFSFCVCKLWQLLYLNDFENCLLFIAKNRIRPFGEIPILGRSFLVFVLRSLLQLLCLQALTIHLSE